MHVYNYDINDDTISLIIFEISAAKLPKLMLWNNKFLTTSPKANV